MTLLPPKSPHFPYTTLFRSAHGSIKHQAKHFFYATGWKKFEPLWDVVIRAKQLPAMTPLLEGVLSKVTRAATRHSDRSGDRKSTRLNSSHRCISYAVFCLKK